MDLQNETYDASSVDALAERAMQVYKLSPKKNEHGQVFIGLAGGPGSGKSTIAEAVAKHINKKEGKDISVVLPMDGYHFSRRQLREMGSRGEVIGNPESTSGESTTFEDLLARRGSPWTFDAVSIYNDFSDAKKFGEGNFPTYSRELSDPVPGGVHLSRDHKIVFCEGNYLLAFDDPLWKQLDELWDDKWFLSVPQDILLKRLVQRHLRTWTDEKRRMWGEGEAGAKKKAEANDLKNAVFIEQVSRKYANVIITF